MTQARSEIARKLKVTKAKPELKLKAVKPAKADKPKKGNKLEKKAAKRIEVRESGIHGKGVYALIALAKGKKIIEYKGERISAKEADRRHPHDPNDPNHTFYFELESGKTIDASYGGNAARWINHSCKPNCESDEVDGRVFIRALRDIEPCEELFYDYGLSIDARYTAKLKKAYECRCGARKCRGTMLAPKR